MTNCSTVNLDFPRILYGKARTTRLAWARVTRAAWKRRAWRDEFSKLEMVPLFSLGEEIWISAMSLNPANEVETWRPYWIGELVNEIISTEIVKLPNEEQKRTATDQFDELLFDGMNHFWFVVGLLATGGGSFYLGAWDRSRPNDLLVREYFSRFVSWLPELEGMQEHFRYTMSGVVEPQRLCEWAGVITALNYQVTGKLVSCQMIGEQYGGSLAAALLDHGIIEEVDGRFRLN